MIAQQTGVAFSVDDDGIATCINDTPSAAEWSGDLVAMPVVEVPVAAVVAAGSVAGS
jgi:hypothetical protein